MIDEFDEEDLERLRRRRERAARMKKEKERQLKIERAVRLFLPAAAVIVTAVICFTFLAVRAASRDASDAAESGAGREDAAAEDVPVGGLAAGAAMMAEQAQKAQAALPKEEESEPAALPPREYSAHLTGETQDPPEDVDSSNVILIDLESGDILAQRDYQAVINPASMTKVLTALVAAENIQDLDDTFTMTREITDYSYSNDCSSVGFAVGEKIPVRDLFYGTLLHSGGDAAVALATYVAGSHEAFVDMMNEKAGQLGLSDTAHFSNCVGLYDEEHHCTVYDMAMIMEAALDDPVCREVMSEHIYTTSPTEEHPDGITISNLFLRRIEDKDTGGEVICAKTGFVNQSGNCAVSYGADNSGRERLCVTTGAHSAWRCIYDHVSLYKKYAKD